jgi:hypothetical protein
MRVPAGAVAAVMAAVGGKACCLGIVTLFSAFSYYIIYYFDFDFPYREIETTYYV